MGFNARPPRIYRDYHLLPSSVLLALILMCRSITTQLDEIIAKYFYLFCATELIPKRRFPTMHFVRYSANFGTKGRGYWNISLIRSETGDPAIESPEELLLPKNQTKALGVHLNRFSAVLAIGGRNWRSRCWMQKKKLILSKEPNNIKKSLSAILRFGLLYKKVPSHCQRRLAITSLDGCPPLSFFIRSSGLQ